MIIAYVSDPYLRAAIRKAAHAEEDVILDRALADDATSWGYPRLVVHFAADWPTPPLPSPAAGVPVLTLTRATLARWETERRAHSIPPGRIDYLTDQLRMLFAEESTGPSWVDRTLSDFGRAAGQPLPGGLRAFARRILEFPSHYDDLKPVAEACGVTRGALKARFRRRSLPSPYTYLRWLRTLATAHLLSDRTVTITQAASRMGYTSDGNLCRSMMSLTGMTPTEARTLRGWNKLLINFAWTHLSAEALVAWHGEEVASLFLRRVA